ncbi:beta 1-4 rhamnosyltransferase Cps2T [Enterococcus gilvus]|uniref:beta 1-4 rhamnosyltransferase Cps2T n=1 Tax=Enterococcus gilvus TaxID=160453 RepID=UPI0028D41598|nr:DUF1972 domain-containing protein [Enterococcus gilvus]
MKKKKQHVYIVGSKGIPAKYGGFETFVEKLTEYQVNRNIQYHVACMTENSAKSGLTEKHFEHNGAKCFNIDVPSIGPARAIYYDILSLSYAIKLAKKNKDYHPIFYVLACRIGPFMENFKKKIEDLNGKLYVNPDGHEWLRAKWSYPIRRYWKYSERLMVKNSDLLICDSKTIEKYISINYNKYYPKTTYIAYGTDLEKTNLIKTDSKVIEWYKDKNIKFDNYYLVVGRFVPENNYKTMIQEFMQSNTKKDLVLIANVEQSKFYEKLKNETNFNLDPRIRFVGTVYDQDLLKFIRENAYAYLHGHEVGGTNPSLLEAMASTKINLLLGVSFNKEVGGNQVLYWNKNSGNLAKLINNLENNKFELDFNPSSIISEKYSLCGISNTYEQLFVNN